MTTTDISSTTIRVLIADDHDLLRAGVRALIELDDEVRVVGEARDGREALRLIAELQPDLVLLDLVMPGSDGFEVLKYATKDFPDTRIIVLSANESESCVAHALRAGAAGYLTKGSAGAELPLAIKSVMNGNTYLSSQFSLETFLEHTAAAGQGRGSTSGLTPRQLEVLRLIAGSHTTKDIARTLEISVKTVEAHRAQLMERLNLHDIAGLVRYAIRSGLVEV